MKNKKVFVGLSGGVDSAVSAALLQQQGFDVTGVFITIALSGYPCPAAEDRISAMRAASHLDIPFIDIDLSNEYEQEVFRPSVEEWKKGRTPNPDTLCNEKIKFGIFFDFCMSRGADYVATGHYAQLRNTFELMLAADSNKDQTYFLWAVPEEKLAKTMFPIGHLQKSEVRKLAEKFGLPNASRKDSQGLCFLGPISLEDMIENEVPQEPGSVLSEDGEVIGKHKGVVHYTLGQRHGFDLMATTPDTTPHFVVGKDIAKNTITVSTNRVSKDATQTRISLTECNWIGVFDSRNCEARYRYRQTLIPATLEMKEGKTALILFAEPYAVPEGQSLVLYQGNRCLGGGVVDSVRM